MSSLTITDHSKGNEEEKGIFFSFSEKERKKRGADTLNILIGLDHNHMARGKKKEKRKGKRKKRENPFISLFSVLLPLSLSIPPLAS